MPKFRIVTTNFQGALGYAHEMEALEGLDAEIIENGELVLPKGPGWGVEVNEAAIRARAPK